MSIIKSVSIQKFRGFHNINISLDANVVAITGQNGTQKTTLLGMLAQPFSLKNSKGKMFGAKTVDGFDFGSQLRDKFKFSPEFDIVGSHAWALILDENVCGRANFSCVSIARKGRSGSGIRFWSSDKSRKKGTGYIQTPVIFLSLKRLLPIGELPKVSVAASGLSEEEQELYKDWHNRILCSQSQIRDVNMLSGAGKSSLAPRTEYSDGVTISSGQDNIGKFILSILSFRRLMKQYPLDYKGGLMFIDELDATLYPAAQIQLLKSMFRFASEYKLQFFFTTHSEAILRYLKVGPYPRLSSIVFLQKLDNAIKAYTDRTLPQIENNLFLNTFDGRVSSPTKVRMYAEDEVAFAFIKSMLTRDMRQRLDLQTRITLGAGDYKKLIEQKIPEFTNNIIVLDGDMNGVSKGIKDSEKKHFKQVAFLPGTECPEKILFEFYRVLPEEDPFWDNENSTFTRQISFSQFPSPPKDTHGYKKWMQTQKSSTGINMQSRMIKRWTQSNDALVRKFRADVLQAYNYVASKLGLDTIEDL